MLRALFSRSLWTIVFFAMVIGFFHYLKKPTLVLTECLRIARPTVGGFWHFCSVLEIGVGILIIRELTRFDFEPAPQETFYAVLLIAVIAAATCWTFDEHLQIKRLQKRREKLWKDARVVTCIAETLGESYGCDMYCAEMSVKAELSGRNVAYEIVDESRW